MIFWLGCGSNVICCGRVLVESIGLIISEIGSGRCGLDGVAGCRCTGDMGPIVRASLLRVLRLMVCMRGSPCVVMRLILILVVVLLDIYSLCLEVCIMAESYANYSSSFQYGS